MRIVARILFFLAVCLAVCLVSIDGAHGSNGSSQCTFIIVTVVPPGTLLVARRVAIEPNYGQALKAWRTFTADGLHVQIESICT